MRYACWMILVGLIVVDSPATSQACGGHRSRCRGHRHHRAASMMQPVYAPVAASMPMSYATPQMAQAPTTYAAPMVAAAPVAPVAEVQPTYEYAASTSGQPAYYYTYDNSGKIIVAQWMDWVFRGGIAAGAPAPPLPIIGALRNR